MSLFFFSFFALASYTLYNIHRALSLLSAEKKQYP